MIEAVRPICLREAWMFMRMRAVWCATYSAHSYNMEYLEDIFFDNKYITGYFYHVDERRQKLVSIVSLSFSFFHSVVVKW